MKSPQEDDTNEGTEKVTEETVTPSCSEYNCCIVRGDTPEVSSSDENEDSAQLINRRQGNGINEDAVGVLPEVTTAFVKPCDFQEGFCFEIPAKKKPPDVHNTEKEPLGSDYKSFVADYTFDDVIPFEIMLKEGK